MTIKLYKISDDKHVVSKTLGTAVDVSGTARGSFEVTGGEIEVASASNLNTYNYCYISETSRYYYINRIEILRNGVYVLSLAVDVLKTYDADIRKLTGTVDRQANKYNGYIQDGLYQSLAYSKIVTKAFPNGMINDSLILMTIG